jgi:hypothetical protein
VALLVAGIVFAAHGGHSALLLRLTFSTEDDLLGIITHDSPMSLVGQHIPPTVVHIHAGSDSRL